MGFALQTEYSLHQLNLSVELKLLQLLNNRVEFVFELFHVVTINDIHQEGVSLCAYLVEEKNLRKKEQKLLFQKKIREFINLFPVLQFHT